ncbi:MAG: hypothetical protein NZ700_05055 [Gemmataceae bacterium]|nr:hypothetical protein [Gemmataceae bacterium]MDW8266451.1 hypothetical protein [Gemmataceae bacterium]
MPTTQQAVVLELAPPPREEIGPYLLLGLSKDAGPEQIDRHWAQRVIWARRNQGRVALEDVHWARDVLRDAGRRQEADAGTFNADTAAGVLRDLTERYHLDRPAWDPIEWGPVTADLVPPMPVPSLDDVQANLAVPPLPDDIPAIGEVLAQLLREPIDQVWSDQTDPSPEAPRKP